MQRRANTGAGVKGIQKANTLRKEIIICKESDWDTFRSFMANRVEMMKVDEDASNTKL